MSEEQLTKAELMEKIADSYEALQRTLSALDEATLARPNPADGWAIKDHLFHLAAWERGIARLLGHRSRYEGMGVTPEEWRGRQLDEINDLVYRRNREQPPAEALAAFRDAHAEMLDALAALSDADLRRPYTDFDPAATQFADRPIVGWIIGDTFDHYDEHRQWIQALLAE